MTNEHDEIPVIDVENNLLPAWFTFRMMTDIWAFGLLTVTGTIIAIEQINKITKDGAGNIWLDATLCHNWSLSEEVNGHKVFVSPTERTDVSINAAHIIAAFELADT